MPKHFLLAGWYPRELTAYQQSYRSSDSNKNAQYRNIGKPNILNRIALIC